jgi:hypothetical protein
MLKWVYGGGLIYEKKQKRVQNEILQARFRKMIQRLD